MFHAGLRHGTQRQTLEVKALECFAALQSFKEISPHGAQHKQRATVGFETGAKEGEEAVGGMVGVMIVAEQLLKLVDDQEHASIKTETPQPQIRRDVGQHTARRRSISGCFKRGARIRLSRRRRQQALNRGAHVRIGGSGELLVETARSFQKRRPGVPGQLLRESMHHA